MRRAAGGGLQVLTPAVPAGPVLIGFANSASFAGLVGRRNLMTDQAKNREPKEMPEAPDRPRLTPQGHASGTASGEDSTDPQGGAKEGQGNKAEG